MDDAGYPEESDLETIRNWPMANGWDKLLEYVRSLWKYPEYFSKDGDRYCLSTGGWSGNEEIIDALMQHQMFWLMCWYSSRRGGHYEFRLGPQKP